MIEYIVILGLQVGIPAIALYYAYKAYRKYIAPTTKSSSSAKGNSNAAVTYYAFVDRDKETSIDLSKAPHGEMFATILGEDYYLEQNWSSEDKYTSSRGIYYKSTGEKLNDDKASTIRKIMRDHFMKLRIEEKESKLLGIASMDLDPLQNKFKKLETAVAQDSRVAKNKEMLTIIEEDLQILNMVTGGSDVIETLLTTIHNEVIGSALISKENLINLLKRRKELLRLEKVIDKQKDAIRKKYPNIYMSDSLAAMNVDFKILRKVSDRIYLIKNALDEAIESMAKKQKIVNPLLDKDIHKEIVNELLSLSNEVGLSTTIATRIATSENNNNNDEEQQEQVHIEEDEASSAIDARRTNG